MSDDKALVKVEPVPPMVLAKDLAAATPRSFVHVDRRGQVRSPARYKAIQAASYGLIATLIGGAAVLYGLILGPVGVVAALGAGALIAFNIRRVQGLQKAARLLLHDRVEEALPILEALANKRLQRRVRALVEQNLAACHNRRGRYAEALEHERASIALHARSRRRDPLAVSVQYAELFTLVNLDRVAEARGILAARHPVVPEGDYLRVLHWAAELYVCLAEGAHSLEADELHVRARTALGITSAAALLGLVAWAHHHAGDLDQAWLCLREADDRRAGVPIEQTLPKLHAWMEAHRDQATEVDPYASL